MFITRSSTFMQDLKLLFKTEHISKVKSAVGSLLMLEVYKDVVAAVDEKVKQKEESSPVMFNVREMPAEGLAKL